MEATDQEVVAKTPVLEPPAASKYSESPRYETVRSDVRRGFSWQNNGVFKDAPCVGTSASLKQGCQVR